MCEIDVVCPFFIVIHAPKEAWPHPVKMTKTHFTHVDFNININLLIHLQLHDCIPMFLILRTMRMELINSTSN